MTPMDYSDGWVNPGRPGQPLARCQAPNCTPDGSGCLVVASTLDEQGRCASCVRDADDTSRLLR